MYPLQMYLEHYILHEQKTVAPLNQIEGDIAFIKC